MSSSVPLKTLRIAALSIAWSWAIVASGVGLNALIEANRSQAALKGRVDPPTVITIDVSDVHVSGIVATTASVLIGVLTFNFVAMMFLPQTRALATRTLRLQAYALCFCCVWLFSCLVPFTLFFATRRADVRAHIGPLELPQSLIHSMEEKSGSTSVYKELSYLRLVAILPWFTLLFTSLAAFVLFKAAGRAGAEAPGVVDAGSRDMSEKESDSQVEKVEKESV
ncbi:hypothetical protein BDZ94DRAFT_1229946 [Collybia nuda]|uniref:Uncharacterized protein n=1 Tax=Collybia nuda TaxID=64659 RepID=A0A9P5XV11_9AGAR|nr:hypothetical protein BDZ94DRAFT_1229946 [Collybia nuda]